MRLLRVFPAALALAALVACDATPSPTPSTTPSPMTAPTTPASPAVPSPSSTPSVAAATEERPPGLAELPRGHAPRVPYVDRHYYVESSGGRIPVRADHGISGVAPYHGGFLVSDTRFFESTVGLALVDNEGRVVDEWCSNGTPVVSADRMLTAYLVAVCPESADVTEARIERGISTGMGEGETVQEVPPRSGIALAGMIGDRVVWTAGHLDGVRIGDLVAEPQVVPHLGSAEAVAQEGLVAGTLSRDENRSGVVDVGTGRLLWARPGVWFEAFSATGASVIGTTRNGTRVYDARTGRVLGELPLPRGHAGRIVWEGGAHALAVVTTRRDIAIVRTSVGGTPELATPVRRYRPADPAYVLLD